MSYLVFSTEQLASQAQGRLVSNISQVVESVLPDRYDNGELIGVDKNGTPQPHKARTTRWDVPRQCSEGWAIVEPTQDKLGVVPLAAAMTGVGGVRYEAVTWPVIELP